MTTESTPETPLDTHERPPELEPLPFPIRLIVLIVGGLLLAVGVAGLALPGIQGILTIVLALAVLSLASKWVHYGLRRLLARWPSAYDRMERIRHRVHGWLSRNNSAPPPDDGSQH